MECQACRATHGQLLRVQRFTWSSVFGDAAEGSRSKLAHRLLKPLVEVSMLCGMADSDPEEAEISLFAAEPTTQPTDGVCLSVECGRGLESMSCTDWTG